MKETASKAFKSSAKDDKKRVKKDSSVEKKIVKKAKKEPSPKNTQEQQHFQVSASTSQPAQDVTCIIGSYELTSRVLGMGSFGTVYYGRCFFSGAEVAVKVVNKKELTETRITRLRSEVELLQQLDHPNIIKLLHVYENDDNVYLVFEYKTGDLYNYIQKNGVMNEMLAMRIFTQLVEAIEYCHSKGIAHLDVKLENILIDEVTLDVYLCDFGFATTFENGTLIEKWCGSPFTVAPEIIIRKPYEPEYADIWAMGSVLYTILCGSYPFQASCVNDTLIKTKAGKINDFQPNVGYSVRDLITRILTLDTNKRYSISQIRKHPWFQLAAGFSRVPEKLRAPDYGNAAVPKGRKKNSPRNQTNR